MNYKTDTEITIKSQMVIYKNNKKVCDTYLGIGLLLKSATWRDFKFLIFSGMSGISEMVRKISH